MKFTTRYEFEVDSNQDGLWQGRIVHNSVITEETALYSDPLPAMIELLAIMTREY